MNVLGCADGDAHPFVDPLALPLRVSAAEHADGCR
jgi:hypothetical protein